MYERQDIDTPTTCFYLLRIMFLCLCLCLWLYLLGAVFISASDVSMSFLPSHMDAVRPVTFRLGSALSSDFFVLSLLCLAGRSTYQAVLDDGAVADVDSSVLPLMSSPGSPAFCRLPARWCPVCDPGEPWGGSGAAGWMVSCVRSRRALGRVRCCWLSVQGPNQPKSSWSQCARTLITLVRSSWTGLSSSICRDCVLDTSSCHFFFGARWWGRG